MTFDEWTDRRRERHEALARWIGAQRIRSEGTAGRLRVLAGNAQATLDSIKRLESIASAHND